MIVLRRGNAGLLSELKAAQRQAAALQRSLDERSEEAAEKAAEARAEAGACLAEERRKLVQAEANKARLQRQATLLAALQVQNVREQAMHAKTAEQLAEAHTENKRLRAALEVAAQSCADGEPDLAQEGMRAVLRVIGIVRTDGNLQQLLLDALRGG